MCRMKSQIGISLISDIFLLSFAISKRIKQQRPATSHLEDFSKIFQMTMDFFIVHAFGSAEINKISCSVFFFVIVIAILNINSKKDFLYLDTPKLYAWLNEIVALGRVWVTRKFC